MVRPSGHNGKRRFYEAPFLFLKFRAGCLPPTNTLHVFVSAKPERQRKRGEPLRAWVLMVKTTMFAACRRSASFSWTFAVAPLVAAPRLLEGRSVGKALPRFHSEPYISRRLSVCCARISMRGHRPSANAKGTPDSLSSVGVFIFKTTSFTNAPRLLCDVFLDFRSRSARGRSATIKRSSARQSTRRLPQ